MSENLSPFKRKIKIINLGCNRREFDKNTIIKNITNKLKNITIVDSKSDNYDSIIIISCGFIEERRQITLKEIEKNYNNGKEIFLYGCINGIANDLLKDYKIHKIKTNNFDILYKILSLNTDSFENEICYSKENNHFKIGYLKISSGCMNRCSYCVIPLGVGNLKSEPISEIKKCYNLLLKNKPDYIVFLSEDCGSYGLDINTNIKNLLYELYNIDKSNHPKWFLETLYPSYLLKYKEYFLNLIKTKKIEVLKLDFQSGSERILKLMKRNYSIRDLKNLVKEIRKLNPEIYLFSQFIIGFPSESEVDFYETVQLIKEIEFEQYEFFAYSDDIHALSHKIEPKIEKDEIELRIGILLKILSKKYDVKRLKQKIIAIRKDKLPNNIISKIL